MTAIFTTDEIDRLQSRKLDPPRGWEITFRSSNAGLQHQLYINGALADVSDTAEQRAFYLPDDACPREVAITAVQPLYRHADISNLLPFAVGKPGWVYSASVIRSIAHHAGDRIALHTDHTTGQLDSEPLLTRELWPAWAPRWVWGESLFGAGGFGFGGIGAPGMGKGALGAGMFGMDADLICIHAALSEPGEHQVVLRTLAEDGATLIARLNTLPPRLRPRRRPRYPQWNTTSKTTP